MRLGIKANYRLKNPEIIHQLHQGNKCDERH